MPRGRFMEHRLREASEATLFLVTHEVLRASETKRWRRIQRRLGLPPAVLIISDALFATAVWGLAYVILRLWGREPVPETVITVAVPTIVVWLGLRALLGLYPGYGLDSV